VLRLHARDAVAASDGRPFSTACKETCRMLGALEPELHIRHEQLQPASSLNACTEHALSPMLLIGTPLLGDRRQPRDLYFPLALRLANLRPERMLRLALPDPSALALLIEAVIALAGEAEGKGRA